LLLPVVWIGASLFFTAVRLHPDEGSLALQRLLAKAINFLGVGSIWVLYDIIPAAKHLARRSFVHDAFFLYAAHLGIILTVMCARFQDILATRLHVPVLGIFFLRIAIPIAISLTIAELLKRFCPRAYALLTGGR
jgi:hypothetical protein